MLRETISTLDVWDIAGRSEGTLEPGVLLSRCRIRRHSQSEVESGAEAYAVELQAASRHCVCPLFRFQPRTKSVESVWAEEIPARDAVAV